MTNDELRHENRLWRYYEYWLYRWLEAMGLAETRPTSHIWLLSQIQEQAYRNWDNFVGPGFNWRLNSDLPIPDSERLK